jgi:serine/threonine protein kinase
MSNTDEEQAARRVGTQLGGWTLERVLGVGGMASVFLGRRADGVACAVKVLHHHFTVVDSLRKRFLREGPIGSALAAVGPLCEGLPQVLESGILPDGTAFLVMELLEGETFFDRLVRIGPLPVGEVIWVAQKVLDVLAVAHAYGIITATSSPRTCSSATTGASRCSTSASPA